MLSKMREHVLNLPKEKLFWLPVPVSDGCVQCMDIFTAQFKALSPKALLLMGEAPLSALVFEESLQRPELGRELVVKAPHQDLPAVWTHHPTYLLDSPGEKGAAMRHLKLLKEVLVRLGVCA